MNFHMPLVLGLGYVIVLLLYLPIIENTLKDDRYPATFVYVISLIVSMVAGWSTIELHEGPVILVCVQGLMMVFVSGELWRSNN